LFYQGGFVYWIWYCICYIYVNRFIFSIYTIYVNCVHIFFALWEWHAFFDFVWGITLQLCVGHRFLWLVYYYVGIEPCAGIIWSAAARRRFRVGGGSAPTRKVSGVKMKSAARVGLFKSNNINYWIYSFHY